MHHGPGELKGSGSSRAGGAVASGRAAATLLRYRREVRLCGSGSVKDSSMAVRERGDGAQQTRGREEGRDGSWP